MHKRQAGFWAWASTLAVGLMAGLASAAAVADDHPPAVMLALQLPITGTRDTQLEAAILRHIEALKADPASRGVLVLRFDAPEDDGHVGSDFGRSLDLARFLTDSRLAGVKTVAFLPRGAEWHAVLVALACEEIVMAADAVLGPANADEPLVDEAMRAAYREIAPRRKTVPSAVAVALLDPVANVVRASTEDGEQYVEAADLPKLRETVAVLETEDVAPVPL